MHIQILAHSVAWQADDVSLHPWFLSPASSCLCVSQGAGAVTCVWLCWRIKPPYTSRTRTPLPSDIISPAPSLTGPPPPMETSDLLSVRSSSLCPDVAESDCTSALTYLNIYSVSGGDQTITTNLPAKSLWLAVKHILIDRIYSIDTLSLLDSLTSVSMGASRRRKISIAANYVHPFTLKDILWTVNNSFFSAKLSIFTPWMWEKKNITTYRVEDDNCYYYYRYCSGY